MYAYAFNQKLRPKSRSRSSGLLMAACLTVLTVAFASCTPSFAAGEMTINGAWKVDNYGQFQYSVPITTPPGTAGMVPQLSLQYSSQNGDGFEGIGWALRGLPAITRCPQTATYDGVHGGVNYDANDRFCLDGEELMLTNGPGHSYGDDGSQYDTLHAKHYLITAHVVGGIVNWFDVHFPNGSVFQLGNTTDSKVYAAGVSSVVREWLVNRMTDVNNNYLTVSYTQDNSISQAYPNEIDFTANDGEGLTAYNSVQFSYENRNDVTPIYQAGYIQKITKRLTHVITYNGTTAHGPLVPILDYQLSYRAGTASPYLHSRLTGLSLCDGGHTKCRTPLSFGWQGGSSLPSASSASPFQVPIFTGDFDGDGLLDIGRSGCPSGGVIYSGSNTPGSFSSAAMTADYMYWDGSHTEQHWTGDACFQTNITSAAGDIDGDGFSDIIATQNMWSGSVESQFTSVLQNNEVVPGGALNQVNLDTTLPQFALLGDFDGDGRTDGFVQTDPSNGKAYTSNGDGTFHVGSAISGTGSNYTLTTGDFDGDGCTDLISQTSSSGAIKFFCPTSSSVSAPSFSGSTIITGDFNGDGLTDVLAIGASSASLYLSNGKGFAAPTTIAGVASWTGYQVIVGDWNGDGKADIALVSPTGGTHLVYLSTGTDFISTTSITNTSSSAFVADANNDGADDIWFKGTNTFYYFALQPELMTSVGNGLGATTTIQYDRLNKNGSFYTKETRGSGNFAVFSGAYYAVSNINVTNGAGGTNYNLSYSYDGALRDRTAPPAVVPKWNIRASRIATFNKISFTDSRNGLVMTSSYQTAFPYTGRLSSQRITAGSATLRSVDYGLTLSWNGPGFPVIVIGSYVTANGNDLSGTAFPPTHFEYANLDSYGNPQTIDQWSGSGSQKNEHITTNTYTNDPANWILGQLTESDDRGHLAGNPYVTRHNKFDHYGNGQFKDHFIEYGTALLQLETDYGYDSFGNMNAVTQVGAAVPTRTNSTDFGATGEFPGTFTNALHQISYATFDPAFGTLKTTTDANSVVTHMDDEVLGRPGLLTKPDGTKVAYDYQLCSGPLGGPLSCPTWGAYGVITTPENSAGAPNGAQSIAYYDALNRPIATDVQGFDGSVIRTTTQYDSNGYVHQTSRPYFAIGGTPQWTTYAYDALSRPTLITYPDTSATQFCYDGLASATTNAKGQIKTMVLNSQYLVASVTEGQTGSVSPSGCVATGGTTNQYLYDTFNNLTQVTYPGSHTINSDYDVRGRKTDTTDPDMGYWQFSYDQLSELTGQTDANGNTSAIAYDVLQRPNIRTEQYPGPSMDLSTQFLWDETPYGIGKFQNACADPHDASNCPTAAYQQKVTYDSLSRIATGKLVLDTTSYTYTPHYNSDGKVDTLTYPSGFVAEYDYNTHGYLYQIKDHTSGSVIWTASSVDAELRITNQTQGSGSNSIRTTNGFDPPTGNLLNVCATYTTGTCNGNVANFSYGWDSIGNLTSRTDASQPYTENFCYDALNRVQNSSMGPLCTSIGTGAKSISYDSLGNITEKSDICNTANCFVYAGTSGAGPHQLTSIAGTYNGVANPTFSYDANGNMTSGAGRTIDYRSFNMTSSITQGSSGVSFDYGAWHGRYKMCIPNCSSPTSVTYYLYDPATGGVSEQIVSGSTTTWRDYIIAPQAGLVAVRTLMGSTVTWRYIVLDHLGSVASVATSTSLLPGIEHDSYDTWGKRRNANGTDAACGSVTSQLNRGYTSQEMLDSQCLINMNARIQDPSLGRFLSSDPVVSDAFNTQAFNRTSYVQNNPLAFTDPTGYVDGGDCPFDPVTCLQMVLIDGQWVEVVEVDANRIYTNNFDTPGGSGGYTGGGGGGGGGPGDQPQKANCNKAIMAVGNFFTAGGKMFEQAGVLIGGIGAVGLMGSAAVSAMGVPAEPAAGVSAGLALTGGAIITAGGYMTGFGQVLQGYAGGSMSPFLNSAGAWGISKLVPSPLSAPTNFAAGLYDAMSNDQNQQTCPAG